MVAQASRLCEKFFIPSPFGKEGLKLPHRFPDLYFGIPW